ncbi:MAG: arylsulfatase A-like enzyme [Verrucomicrobiales bacterium]|jgi:arylsulfatase A-like enzyme
MRVPISAFFLGLSAFSAGAEPPRTATDQPNLIFIVADDLGWGDLGINGSPICETPRIDEFAASGARFERLFVSAESAPTSAAILTGLHPLLAGVCSDSAGGQDLHGEMLTLAEKLEPLGYQSGYFGAWRHGANRPQRPDDQGFETFVGICRDQWVESGPAIIEFGAERRNLESARPEQLLADSVRDFIEKNVDQPFLCILNHPSPFFATSSEADLEEKYRKAGCSSELARIYAAVGGLDREVGAIVDHLADLGIDENTVVFFLSDNGPSKLDGRFNGGMHGANGSVHEGGMRAPCFVRWKGAIEPGTVIKEICHVMDLHITAVEIAGGDLHQTLEPTRVRWLQGMSITPLLLYGNVNRWPNRNLNAVAVTGRNFDEMRTTVRVSRWRAVKDPDWRRKPVGEDDETWELYDLLADPHQTYDLADFYPAVLGRLKSDFIQWYRRVTTHGFDPLPTEIGREDWETVRLLAEVAPKSESGALAWPIEVLSRGKRTVSIVYRSAAAGASQVSLRAGDSLLVEAVSVASEWATTEIGELEFENAAAEFEIEFDEGIEIREIVIE